MYGHKLWLIIDKKKKWSDISLRSRSPPQGQWIIEKDGRMVRKKENHWFPTLKLLSKACFTLTAGSYTEDAEARTNAPRRCDYSISPSEPVDTLADALVQTSNLPCLTACLAAGKHAHTHTRTCTQAGFNGRIRHFYACTHTDSHLSTDLIMNALKECEMHLPKKCTR